jgi:hypothetical protein
MLTQTSAGWTFTLGRETFGPYSTRDQAAEALYDLQRGRPAVSPEQIIIDTIDRALQADDDRIALAREADRLLDADDLAKLDRAVQILGRDAVLAQLDRQPDPHSIPESVAKVSYPLFAACCARIETLGLAPQLLDAAIDQVVELIDQLTSPATVAALARAWAAEPPAA